MEDNKEQNHHQEFENQEWIDSIEYVIQYEGIDRARELLTKLKNRAYSLGVQIPEPLNSPHINTISPDKELPYPGNREIERRIKSLIRWNAMAMVVKANKESEGIGGHISSFASSATLYEVAQN
ncbi:MAG: pyruvate dehydrogenase (acetyl-transferring), homodimeric type, partial [Bacteroidota bacterium]